MGRGKLQLELIKKEKARKNTFEKRKNGLLKKMYEFVTLCDVDACMIIYNTINSPNLPPEIWPPHSPSSVLTMARRFKSLSLEERSRHTVNLTSFYNERMKKVESEVAKLKSSSTTTSSSSSSTMFQSWDPCLENLSYDEMTKVSSNIDSKLQQVKARLALLKTHAYHQQQQQQLLQHQQQHHPQQQLHQFQLEQLQHNSFNYMNNYVEGGGEMENYLSNYVREAAPLNVQFPEPLLPGAMVAPSPAPAVMDVVNGNFSVSYSRFPWLLYSDFSPSPPPPLI